jgi:hypothetical protein
MLDNNQVPAQTLQAKRFYGRNLDEYVIGFEGIPRFLSEAVKYFYQHPAYL